MPFPRTYKHVLFDEIEDESDNENANYVLPTELYLYVRRLRSYIFRQPKSVAENMAVA